MTEELTSYSQSSTSVNFVTVTSNDTKEKTKNEICLENVTNMNKGTNNNSSNVSVQAATCRICQTHSSRYSLVSPCNCKGSLAYVHVTCLEKWLNACSRDYCELCQFVFEVRQVRRYTLFQSLRVWVRHPLNRRYIQTDLFIILLLTIISIGLVFICVIGHEYFVFLSRKYGVAMAWARGLFGFFILVIMIGYMCALVFLVRDQFLPWLRWWRNTYNVRLLLKSTKHVMQKHRASTEPASRENGVIVQKDVRESLLQDHNVMIDLTNNNKTTVMDVDHGNQEV